MFWERRISILHSPARIRVEVSPDRLQRMPVRVILANDAEAREEECMAGGPYTGPLTVINV